MKGADEKKLDVRLTQRNLEDGTLSKKEFTEHLHKLPDLSEEAEWVSCDEESGDPKEG